MRGQFRPFLVTLLLSSVSLGQAPTPPAAPSAPRSTAPTIQSRTNLVVVDVVVTDRSGKNVHGLQQSDFVVSEKGATQQIRSFEEHIAPVQQDHAEPAPDLPPGVFTNYTPVPNTSSLNVLLLDTLNTPLQDQEYVRQQLISYLRSAHSGDRISIFGLTTHLIYLQGFTSDPAILRAAIDKKSIRASQVLDRPANGGNAQELSDTVASPEASSHGAIANAVDHLKQFEAQSKTFQIELRTRYTLDAMNALAHYLSGFPGRKNLIWFSGSFPFSVLPNADVIDPFAVMADMSEEFRDTTSLLARSQVAVYPVDARGLFTQPMYDSSQRGPTSPESFSTDLRKFEEQTSLEHSTMLQMAEQTGGHAFINTNGLKEALDTAVTTGANFYTITYTPSDTNWNGAFRKIDLRLQPGVATRDLTLAYRRGYFAIDPNPRTLPPRPALDAGATPALPSRLPATNTMRIAMTRGAPEPTGIVLKARVLPTLPGSAPPEDAPDPATHINTSLKLARGPWRRFSVDVTAVAAPLLPKRAANGNFSGAAEFVIRCYDAEGTLVSVTSNVFGLDLTADNVRRMAGSGVPFHGTISVPATGDYFLRIGVHDLIADHVGAIEVPLKAVRDLPPLAAVSPQQAPSAHP